MPSACVTEALVEEAVALRRRHAALFVAIAGLDRIVEEIWFANIGRIRVHGPGQRILAVLFGKMTKSPSHKVRNPRSRRDFVVHAARGPQDAGWWRGGRGETRTTQVAGAVADSRRPVGADSRDDAERGAAAERGPTVDRAAPDCRWRFVRVAHGLSVEGRAPGIWLGLDRTPALSAVGG